MALNYLNSIAHLFTYRYINKILMQNFRSLISMYITELPKNKNVTKL